MNQKLTKSQLKNIKRMINVLRNKGHTDQEIYNELQRRTGQESKTIYNLIISTPTEEAKSKYQILNNIIIVILITSLVMRAVVISNLLLLGKGSVVADIVLSFLAICLPLTFLIQVVKYNARVYKVMGWLFIIGFLHRLGLVISGTIHVTSAYYSEMIADLAIPLYPLVTLDLILPIFCAVLSFYAVKKLFPKFKASALTNEQLD
jgi:hypothetical protein